MINYYRVFGFEPTQEQKQALNQIKKFIDSDDDVFILKGSAGTGKTSIVKVITNQLVKENTNFYVSAPTGRAAMIIGSKTNQKSGTMHSLIYKPESVKDSIKIKLVRKINQEDTFSVFLVDEASLVGNTLIPGSNFYVNKPLLYDFIDYVKQGNNKNKIIFIGDRFQLPPVYENFSTALDHNYLAKHFNLKCSSFELTKVMRQSEGSDILDLATNIRNAMIQGYTNLNIAVEKENYASNAMRKYMSFFDSNKQDNTIAVCYSNRDVDYWNDWVRRELGISQSYISENDFVINQNTWMNRSGEWVQKDELGKIVFVDSGTETFAGLKFADAVIEFPISSGNKKIIKTKILLNSLYTNYGILSEEQEKKLYAEVMKYNSIFRTSKKVADDKYLGAMRLRHSYAVTCHKAQGGEWNHVLIHPFMIGKNLKWTYTAITRAKKSVFSYAA